MTRSLQFTPEMFGVLLQYPASDGAVADHTSFITRAHAAGVQVAVAADLLSLALLTPPGEFGADAVVGSAQRFGVPDGLRRSACRLPRHDAMRSSATCPDASSACRSMRMATPHCAWRCRHASSTSAGKKRHPTSAPRRCSWPSWPACTPSIMAPKGSAASRHASMNAHASSPSALQDAGHAIVHSAYFDTLRIRPQRVKPEAVRKYAGISRLQLPLLRRRHDRDHAG